MARPQNSPKGYFAKQRIDIGGAQLTYDSTGNLRLNAGLALSGETTDVVTQNSTAIMLAGGIALSGQAVANAILQDSTAVKLPDGLSLSGQGSANAILQDSTAVKIPDGLSLSGKASSLAITQNSTSVNVPGGLKVSGQANAIMTGLSTGVVLTAIKIGAHWLTANSTGLKIGANQVTTA